MAYCDGRHLRGASGCALIRLGERLDASIRNVPTIARRYAVPVPVDLPTRHALVRTGR